MILNKYSEIKQNSTTIGSYSSKKSSSSSSSSSSNKSVGLDRIIWGQDDDGGDLDGDLTCGGNIYIVDNYDENEDDENEDTDSYIGATRKQEPIMPLSIAEDLKDKFDNDEGGNCYVKRQLVVDKNITTPEIYSKTIYLDYPELKNDSSNKTNLLDILKDHKKLTFKDSKNNELGTFDNTADKTITIKNYDDEISSLNSRVGTNETNISNNATEITNIWEAINSTDTSSPVVLFSGSIHSNNQDTSSTNYQPWNVRPNLYSQHLGVNNIEFNYYEVSGEKKPSLVVTLKAKDGWTIKPTSVNSSVTLAVHWNPTADFGGNRRSQGYWTTGGVFIDGKIYLQVWRTGDDNNDTVTNDCIAWQAQEMNVTIYGTAFKNS